MDSGDRQQISTIEESLFEAGYSFDFYQAVKLINILNPERAAESCHRIPKFE